MSALKRNARLFLAAALALLASACAQSQGVDYDFNYHAAAEDRPLYAY